MEFPGIKTVMKALPSSIGNKLSPEIVSFKKVRLIAKVGINPRRGNADIELRSSVRTGWRRHNTESNLAIPLPGSHISICIWKLTVAKTPYKTWRMCSMVHSTS
jgi:hypothetical protein